MTTDDDLAPDRAPGLGDPAKSDDLDVPALRQGGAGRGPGAQASGPAPSGGEPEAIERMDTGASGPQGGQLGSAGGGYGSGSAERTSGGTPDGEDVQRQAGPGPQTDWLRSEGTGDARRLAIDAHDEQVGDPASQAPTPSQDMADDARRNFPDAEPG